MTSYTFQDCPPIRLAIVGEAGGTHVGESLRSASEAAGHRVLHFHTQLAFTGARILKSLAWRFADKRPLSLNRFSSSVVRECEAGRVNVLIATGRAPLTATALHYLRSIGVAVLNYSTDDPWNPSLRSNWFLEALPHYDTVFSTRRSNIEDFRRLGCTDVQFLPFGFDDRLFNMAQLEHEAISHDVLFVGGADGDRVAFMTEFMQFGPQTALVGGYWESFSDTRPFALGQRSPESVCGLTVSAKVNLCLVRRANRDGHVMRSFEIAAIGGCMLAEDTPEHREIFGEDGEAVTYFRSARQAAERARVLLDNPGERARLSAALRARIARGRHTYRDRLSTMLAATHSCYAGSSISENTIIS
jgi:spore maturation protein CgeB